MVSPIIKLAIEKMSRDAIPANGGLVDALEFLSDPAKVSSTARAAEQWARDAITAVRNASDPNPWRQSGDEEIAEEILRQIKEKRK